MGRCLSHSLVADPGDINTTTWLIYHESTAQLGTLLTLTRQSVSSGELFRALHPIPISIRIQKERFMAKPATIKIKLLSTADTGFFYVTKKNPRNTTEKMTFRKYDPVVRKHVEFKEAKVK